MINESFLRKLDVSEGYGLPVYGLGVVAPVVEDLRGIDLGDHASQQGGLLGRQRPFWAEQQSQGRLGWLSDGAVFRFEAVRLGWHPVASAASAQRPGPPVEADIGGAGRTVLQASRQVALGPVRHEAHRFEPLLLQGRFFL